MLVIGTVVLALRLRGFGRTLALAKRLSARIPMSDVNGAATVAKAAHNVAVAGALFPGRARCLEQSLALFTLLRRRGIYVEFKLGVQPYRFRAHAWVEHHGIPVNEYGEMVHGLVALPEIQQ
jgi:hypothetical protein